MNVTRHDFRPALLYAAATDTLIPWDWITTSRDSAPFMVERERVRMLLDAVNGEWIQVNDWSRLCGARLDGGPIRVDSSSWKAWSAQRIPLVEEARRPLRAALEGLLRDPENAVPEVRANILSITDGRVISIREVSHDGVQRDRVIAHSIGAALIFSLGLVFDPGKPYRRELRQCALPRCGKFALGKPSERRGQPANFYCLHDHRSEYRKQQNRERAAASRAGVSVERYRQRQSKQRSRA
jgi:hypothetical protein